MSGNELYFQGLHKSHSAFMFLERKILSISSALTPSSPPKAPRSLVHSPELAVLVWKATKSMTNREQVTTFDGRVGSGFAPSTMFRFLLLVARTH